MIEETEREAMLKILNSNRKETVTIKPPETVRLATIARVELPDEKPAAVVIKNPAGFWKAVCVFLILVILALHVHHTREAARANQNIDILIDALEESTKEIDMMKTPATKKPAGIFQPFDHIIKAGLSA